jgi:hypothetical protein
MYGITLFGMALTQSASNSPEPNNALSVPIIAHLTILLLPGTSKKKTTKDIKTKKFC